MAYAARPYGARMRHADRFTLANDPLHPASAGLGAGARVRHARRPVRFLALAVLFHHAAIDHVYIEDGRWVPPASRFDAMLGPVAP